MDVIEILLIIVLPLIFVIIIIWFLYEKIRPYRCKENHNYAKTEKEIIEFVSLNNGTPYLVKRRIDGSISDDPFKILTCADMHNRTDDSEFSLTILSRFIDKEKPDLVILLGDNVVGRDDTVLQEKLIRFFEEREQYWGFVLGNHDCEFKSNREIEKEEVNGKVLSDKDKEKIYLSNRKWMFDSLSKSKYCVVSNSERDIFGFGNCAVNIKNSFGIIQTLFFFDSGDYIHDKKIRRKGFVTEKRSYDYIKDNQIEWYQNKLLEITKENEGKRPKSIAFFHIPLMEFQDAFNKLRRNSKEVHRFYGNNYEPVCASNIRGNAFEAFKNSLSTHIVVCGHDHKNDSSIEYQGIRLMNSQGLQYDGSYNRRKKTPFLKLLNKLSKRLCCYNEGVTLFMVKTDGSVEVIAKYAQIEDVFSGLDKYFNRAFFLSPKKQSNLKMKEKSSK